MGADVSGSAKALSSPATSPTSVVSQPTSAVSVIVRDQPVAYVDPPIPDQALQDQSRVLDAAAARIWERHRAYLYGLGLRWLRGDRAATEDAVADVIYKAIAMIGTGRGKIANERAWLTRVLHNRCMDIHRHRYRIQPLAGAAADARDERNLDDMRSDRSAEELMLNRELGEMIGRALADLPDSLRGPVSMRLIEDEPYSSISEMFSISETNARKRIQQARQILRERLETYLHGRERRPTAQQPLAADNARRRGSP
jgi:RNA polymerase sigma factor (sigma-70 family)